MRRAHQRRAAGLVKSIIAPSLKKFVWNTYGLPSACVATRPRLIASSTSSGRSVPISSRPTKARK